MPIRFLETRSVLKPAPSSATVNLSPPFFRSLKSEGDFFSLGVLNGIVYCLKAGLREGLSSLRV